MGWQIVEDHDLSRPQDREQCLLYEGDEQFGVCGRIEAHRRLDAVEGHGGDGADELPVAVRHPGHHPLARRGASVGALHVRRGAELVDKHELIGPYVGELVEPRLPCRLHVGPVLLGGVGGLFFRGSPSRRSVRLTVPG